MKDNVDLDIGQRLAKAWKCGIFGFVYSCVVDFDHIWAFILKCKEPLNVTGIYGRPLHSPIVFLLYAVVVALGLTAFVLRRSNQDMKGDSK